MLKLLIFDMDGTLFDTDKIIIETWKEVITFFKGEEAIIDEGRIRTYSGPPIDFAINDALPEFERASVLKEYRTRAVKYYDLYLRLFDNAKKTLQQLHDEGFLLTILTSKNKQMTLKCLRDFDLLDLFSDIITDNDVFKNKPDPEAIIHLLKKYNIKSNEAMMIGDSYFDMKCAENAGILSTLMSFGHRIFAGEINPTYTFDSFAKFYDKIKEIRNN